MIFPLISRQCLKFKLTFIFLSAIWIILSFYDEIQKSLNAFFPFDWKRNKSERWASLADGLELSFMISFQSCQIPKLQAWDTEISGYLKPVKLPLICNGSEPDLSYLTQDGYLTFYQNLISQYRNLNCSYSCVKRGKNDHDIAFGIETSLNTDNGTKIECQFIQVNCFSDGQLVYARPHSQIIVDKPRLALLDQILPANKHEKYHNVILFIIDSASRLNFERFCPKSKKLLDEYYKAITFTGMTRIGKETYSNSLAMLAGKKAYNYSNDVIFHQYYDKWSFIWNNYSSYGYITMDDQDSLSNLFLVMKKGFKKQPTHHRLRVFWLAVSKLLHVTDVWNHMELCYRNEPKHKIQFDYLNRFLATYERRPKFIMFGNGCLSHDFDETLAYFDDDFVSFLQENNHLLKESFLFVMADHGGRFGHVTNTHVGRLEAHMPLLMISLPETLRNKHPKILQNMKENSKLLISHYDTFVTLHDILQSSRTDDWRSIDEQKDWSHVEVEVSNAQSYLRPLDLYRTCQQIGIPPESCICSQNYISISNSNLSPTISSSVIDELNRIVSIDKRCANMKIRKVLNLQQFVSSNQDETKYRVLVQVIPSNGTFEANVRFDANKFVIDGEILRTNKYGNQYLCIANDHPSIKPYCYCT